MTEIRHLVFALVALTALAFAALSFASVPTKSDEPRLDAIAVR